MHASSCLVASLIRMHRQSGHFAIASAVGLLIAAAGPAVSQGVTCPGGGMGSGQGGGGNSTESVHTYDAPAIMFKGVTGAAYSGQMTSENVRTLANGTRLSQPPRLMPLSYRDSLGRTRTDALMTQQPLGRNPTPQIQRLAQIDDTVAGYRYIIDDFHQIVHRLATCTPAPPPVRLSAPAQGALVVQGGEVTTEDLGTQIMSGVTVTGRRQTITFPPGTYQGNDAPVTRLQETWRSAQYGLEFLTKSTNPQGDTNSQTMSKFTPGEPDPALFLPPPGYRIVDETAPFTIRIPYQPPQ